MIYLRSLLLGCLLGLALGSASVRAAITVSVGTATSVSGNNISVSPLISSSTFSGDVLIAQVVVKDSATITAPSGWTEISNASTSSGKNGVEQRIYFLNLTAAPASSYTWTIKGNGTSGYASSVIYTLHGAVVADCGSGNTTSCGSSYQAGGGSSATAPNVHATYAAGSLRMAFFATNNGGNAITPKLENAATQGAYLLSGGDTNGVGIDASYYLMTSDSDGGSQSAALGNGGTDNVASSFVIKAAPLALTCVSDNFDRSSGLGSDWVTTRISGNFTPAVVSNRLRLTDTAVNESTAVSFQRLFPGVGNYVQLMFKYYGYGGSGADGIAAILSDSSITPQPGGFGGSMGYAPKGATAGFAGGWLGVGLDEYGNFSNRNDSGLCAPGVPSCATSAVQQSVSIRGSASNYYWLKGTGTLATPVTNSVNNGHLYRVTVDSRVAGQALVSVERDTTGAGTSYTTLISSFNAAAASGQAAIPANFILSLTGSTGTSTNNHEIDDLQVCAQTMNPMTPQIDHYRFTVTTTPLTCTPASVTVKACMDAACTTTYSGNVTATLTPTGWVGGDSQTFAGSGASLSLSKTTAGSYTLGVSGSTPQLKSFSQPLCSIGGGAYSTNCALTFADAGLLYTVPAQTSGVTSAAVTITAAKKDDINGKCVPAFTGSRSIKFWSGYVSPATGTLALAVNGSNIATASPGTAVALNFDANAESKITLNYPDAGQISLNARYDGSAANADAGLVMTGSSSFPVVPYKLCVDSPDAGWNCAATQANAQNPANCGVFKTAGSSFNLRVTGKAASGAITDACALPTTPNYQQSAISLGSMVFAPTGGQNGALSPASINIVSNGTATISTSESDVGVFTLSATPAAGTYFGLTAPSGSNAFGRFIPAGFTVGGFLINRSDIATCNAVPANNTFTYLDEPLSAAVTLNAVNAAGTPTQNYTGNYARLNLAAVASPGSNGLAFGAQSGTSLLNTRLLASCTSCPAFNNGSTVLSADLTVRRLSGITGTLVDGPFNGALLGLAVRDADGVVARSPNYDWDLNGTNDGARLGSSNFFFGRIRLENAYGSPALNLKVPMYAQYWNGSTFVKKTDDNCTTVKVPTSVAMGPTTPAALYCDGGVGLYGSLTGVVASMNGTAAGGTATLVAGDASVLLTKPTNSGGGYLDLAPSAPEYLKYNVDGADQASPACTTPGDSYLHDDNPRARIRFGARRNDNIIYLREAY